MLSIATVSEQGPWCASCFYAWDEEKNAMVITTDPVTRHGAEFRTNPQVAGTIALETNRIGAEDLLAGLADCAFSGRR